MVGNTAGFPSLKKTATSRPITNPSSIFVPIRSSRPIHTITARPSNEPPTGGLDDYPGTAVKKAILWRLLQVLAVPDSSNSFRRSKSSKPATLCPARRPSTAAVRRAELPVGAICPARLGSFQPNPNHRHQRFATSQGKRFHQRSEPDRGRFHRQSFEKLLLRQKRSPDRRRTFHASITVGIPNRPQVRRYYFAAIPKRFQGRRRRRSKQSRKPDPNGFDVRRHRLICIASDKSPPADPCAIQTTNSAARPRRRCASFDEFADR